jgi:hypothetical protein
MSWEGKVARIGRKKHALWGFGRIVVRPETIRESYTME